MSAGCSTSEIIGPGSIGSLPNSYSTGSSDYWTTLGPLHNSAMRYTFDRIDSATMSGPITALRAAVVANLVRFVLDSTDLDTIGSWQWASNMATIGADVSNGKYTDLAWLHSQCDLALQPLAVGTNDYSSSDSSFIQSILSDVSTVDFNSRVSALNYRYSAWQSDSIACRTTVPPNYHCMLSGGALSLAMYSNTLWQTDWSHVNNDTIPTMMNPVLTTDVAAGIVGTAKSAADQKSATGQVDWNKAEKDGEKAGMYASAAAAIIVLGGLFVLAL